MRPPRLLPPPRVPWGAESTRPRHTAKNFHNVPPPPPPAVTTVQVVYQQESGAIKVLCKSQQLEYATEVGAGRGRHGRAGRAQGWVGGWAQKSSARPNADQAAPFVHCLTGPPVARALCLRTVCLPTSTQLLPARARCPPQIGKDSRIAIVLESAVPMAGGAPPFAQLQVQPGGWGLDPFLVFALHAGVHLIDASSCA